MGVDRQRRYGHCLPVGPILNRLDLGFSYLAFAVLWGVVLFSERLDAAAILGTALIALAGIIVVRR